MFPRTFLPVSILIVGFAAFSPIASANPKTNATKAAQAAEAKLKAQAEERKKQDEEQTLKAQGFYNDVHQANPQVTVDQIKSMSSEDIRNLYFHSYIANGIPFSEARSKASALKIWDN